MTTLAIMQPYFAPYLGYFRLLLAADCFVIYDCVQFPRRGWVHRNRLTSVSGNADWLTLALAKAPQSTPIAGLQFREDAANRFADNLQRFPALRQAQNVIPALMNSFGCFSQPVVDYLIMGLQQMAAALQLPFNVIRSSELAIDRALTGQQRIIAICKKLGATHYINSPGGRELYSLPDFSDAGICLQFLAPYQGPYTSSLERLALEPHEQLRQELTDNLRLTD